LDDHYILNLDWSGKGGFFKLFYVSKNDKKLIAHSTEITMQLK
jgi:hypothetical protein